jgi:hypothetical protein
VKRTQTCVLRRKASSAGDVDNEGHLALVVSEADLVARDGRHGDVVEIHERRPYRVVPRASSLAWELVGCHQWACDVDTIEIEHV